LVGQISCWCGDNDTYNVLFGGGSLFSEAGTGKDDSE
jgi:hypothetical protein